MSESEAEKLLDTVEGLSLANAAWKEGYHAGSTFARRDERGEAAGEPHPWSPYSAPLLKRIKQEGADDE